MLLKILIILFLFLSSGSARSSKDYFYNNQGANKANLEDDRGDESSISDKETDDTYEDAIYYEFVQRSFKKKITKYNSNSSFSFVNNMTKEDKNDGDHNQNKEKKDVYVRNHHLTGYCTFKNPVEVFSMPSYTKVDCTFNDELIKKGEFLLSLIPVNKSEILIGGLVYVKDKKGNIYNANKGVVLNTDRTSLNIANFINDVELKKVKYQGLTKIANTLLSSTSEYLKDERNSLVQSQITYIKNDSGNTTPVTTTTNEKPELKTYLFGAGVALASDLINIISSIKLQSIKYNYKIYKDNQIYIDTIVTEQLIGKKKVEEDKSKNKNIYDSHIKQDELIRSTNLEGEK